MAAQEDLTQLLVQWNDGDETALNQLMTVVYDELRRLADSYLSHERSDHTLQPTALVHEAYLRLVGQQKISWQSRGHFFGIAARLMRQILVEHARARHADKRGGPNSTKLSLDDAVSFFDDRDVNLTVLDEALNRLETFDSQQSRIVELRFFGGLTIEDVAEVTGVSPATVKREWRAAKAWLYKEISSK
jgi:RNA polymerase sigma factor (TIGR02999 family)